MAVFAGALLAAVGVAARLAKHRAVQREFREQPRLALVALVGLLVLAVPVGLAVQDAAGRWGVATALLAALAFGWHRARPAYGASRGLPPGSLGLDASLRAVEDVHFYAEGFRHWGSVFKMSQLHRPVVCVGDLNLAQELLKQEGGAIRQVDWPFNRLLPGKYVEFMDGGQHARFRALFEPGFGQEVLQACEADLSATVCAAVAALGSAPAAAPWPVCSDLAYRTLLRAVVGVDTADPRVAGAPAILALLDRGVHPCLPASANSRRAFAELCGSLRDIGAAFAAMPDTVVPQSVLGDLVRRERTLIDDALVVANLATLLQDGHNMLRMLLLWLVKRAAIHPETLDAVRAALSDASDAEARAREFTLEVLRMDLAFYAYRKTVADCRIGPFLIPRGWLVRVCLHEAHCDSRYFEQPLDFAPARFRDRAPAAERFWPFSAGMHACFAQPLVMAVATQFLRALAAYDLRLLADGSPERANRHWAFAVPSRSLRVSLSQPTRAPARPGPGRKGGHSHDVAAG